ncbi:MAG: hypothetical protein WB660_10295 [Candidatus Sulfotelmatobacter sp.]
MPMDHNGLKPYQVKIAEEANDVETYGPVFGSGCMEEISRKYVNELRDAVSSTEMSQTQSKNALEKLQCFAEQGSKFAQAALAELGIGTRTMNEKEFKATVDKLGLDDRTKRRLISLGPRFLSYVGNLSSEDTPEARMQLKDLADRIGGEAAEQLIAEFNESESETVAVAFMNANPDYVRTEENRTALIDMLGLTYLQRDTSSGEYVQEVIDDLLVRGFFTVENLTAAFKLLHKEGLMDSAEGQPKPLSKDEQQKLSLAAATLTTEADLDRFLSAYLSMSLGDSAPRSWRQVIAKSEFAGVLFDGVMFAWSHKRADYQPSEGAEEYIKRYLAGRFPTFPLLDAAWNKCVKETDGRGLVTEEEAIVEDAQSYDDASGNP